jgi:hypothetical protein
MRLSIIRTLAACVLLGFVSGAVSHDLIQEPPWRDWLYGSITEPDHVANGTRNFQFAQTIQRSRNPLRCQLHLHENAHSHRERALRRAGTSIPTSVTHIEAL